MKQVKAMVILGSIIIGFGNSSLAQNVLPEVTVISRNYKYIKSVSDPGSAEPVKMLQRQAAVYDVKQSEFYEEDYDAYFISFYIPQGSILATYDKDGKLLRTAEKFKNVAIPASVRKAVNERFPKWSISSDVYLVNFFGADEGEAKKMYKLTLVNGDKRMKVKTDDKGMFID